MSRTVKHKVPKPTGRTCTYCDYRKAPRPWPKEPEPIRPSDRMSVFDAVGNCWFLGHVDET